MPSSLKYIIIVLLAIGSPWLAKGQINTDQVLRIGQNALYFDDYVLSIQYFNQVIQAKPYQAKPYLMRAIAKLNLDDYDGARADATTALELNPFLPDAWEVRGVAYQNLGNDSAAVEDYDRALELLPRNRQIMFNKALAQTNTKQYAQADSTFSDILKHYPNFDNGYLGRAKLRLAMGDTVAASQDIDIALEKNPNAFNGYLMRSGIAIEKHSDFARALQDMEKAIKLEPRIPGLYINRAYLRYSLDDYHGAMSDYDYALQLEPLNEAALFNRSLLLMEVLDYSGAVRDLSKILQLNPNDDRARYNRAVAYGQSGHLDEAIADISDVMRRNPELSGTYFLRSEYYREKGEMKKSEEDYKKGMQVAKTTPANDEPEPMDEFNAEAAARRFNTLLTIENEAPIDEEYNNTAIRGRVQDRDLAIEIEPLIELSYYSAPTELSENTFYIKEVDDINATRILRFVIMAVSNIPPLDNTDLIKRHFESIDYYNSYIATHTPRAIDYIGRAMDFVTVKNYESAIADLDRALALTPDQPVAYFLRAQARYHNRQPEEVAIKTGALSQQREMLTLALADIDKVIELAPRTAPAWFDKGNILYDLGDYAGALAAYDQAISLAPNMGVAYYNRGYIHLKQGRQQDGIADLSKAGELGIVSAYNLIKKIK